MTKKELESRCEKVELQIIDLLFRCEYVFQHRFGPTDPVGTRLVAIEDLKAECKRAKELLKSDQQP